MTEEFILSIDYKGQQRNLNTKLLLQGHTHKFQVMVDETEVFFEPDEEGHYRAVKMPWQDEKKLATLDKQLLSQIQQKIEEILA